MGCSQGIQTPAEPTVAIKKLDPGFGSGGSFTVFCFGVHRNPICQSGEQAHKTRKRQFESGLPEVGFWHQALNPETEF